MAAKFCVSAGLIWALYRNVPGAELRAHLEHLRLAILVPALALLLFNTLLSAWKWQILLRADGIRVPLGKLFASYIVGSFFSLFLPTSIGGDAYRVYDLSRHSAKPANALASVLADRLSGFLALVCLSLLAAVPVACRTSQHFLVVIAFLGLVGIVAALVTLSLGWPGRIIRRISRAAWTENIAAFADRLTACFQIYQRQRTVVLRIMAISFLFQVSVIVFVFLLSRCLNLNVHLVYFVAFVPLISLLENIPLSIYGIGIRDAGYAFFFGLAGVSAVDTRAMALLYLLTSVAYALLGGIVFLFRKSASNRAQS